MKIILIDNYDSFTYNVSEYLYLLKQSATIVRNDKFNLNIIKKFDKIIISPGPGGPNDAGKCLEVVNIFILSKKYFWPAFILKIKANIRNMFGSSNNWTKFGG